MFDRGERIWTSDPLNPIQVRFQTALRPDTKHDIKMAEGQGFEPWLTGPEPVVLPLDDPPAKLFLTFNEKSEDSQEKN